MNPRSLTKLLIILPAIAMVAGGCFTGVESTPRIDASDVKRQNAATVTAEQRYLSDFAALPPRQWTPGVTTWRVADNRISLIFSAASAPADNLAGTDLVFGGFVPARSLTGDDATDVVFNGPQGNYYYRLNGYTAARIDTLSSLEIPFTVDLELVGRLDKELRGRKFFVRTPAWYDLSPERKAVRGLRHIEVEIDSVVAGNDNFPAAVVFHVTDPSMASLAVPDGAPRMVFMTVGDGRTSTRNFDTLFSFADPRKSYPEIKDDVWELIIRSKVREGMSRAECRLALGAPPSVLRVPTHGGMRETWSYSDGVFLVFDDGYLTRFRL